MLKCLWSEIFFHIFLKYTVWNTRFQSLRCLRLKLTILQAFKVVLFCPQKWYSNCAAKIPRDKSCWRRFGARRWFSMAESRAGKRQRGQYCVAGAPNQQSCQNRSFTPGICMYKFHKDPVVRGKWVQFVRRHRHDFQEILHLRTRRFVLPISKNRVLRKTWLYSVAWRPKVVLKWIGAWREMQCQPGSDYILFRQLRRSLAIAGKDKWDFHLF